MSKDKKPLLRLWYKTDGTPDSMRLYANKESYRLITPPRLNGIEIVEGKYNSLINITNFDLFISDFPDTVKEKLALLQMMEADEIDRVVDNVGEYILLIDEKLICYDVYMTEEELQHYLDQPVS